VGNVNECKLSVIVLNVPSLTDTFLVSQSEQVLLQFRQRKGGKEVDRE
jgi:hypothetical protein